jgi:hypothetical protein
MTYFPHAGDTEEIKDLGSRARDIDSAISVLRRTLAEVETQIGEARIALRPTFPTERQRELLGYAARNIKDGTKSKSHLGDPALDGDYTVVVDGARGWISVRDLAPTNPRNGYRCWEFTEADVAAFAAILVEEGLDMVDHWFHQDGVSIVVRPVA